MFTDNRGGVGGGRGWDELVNWEDGDGGAQGNRDGGVSVKRVSARERVGIVREKRAPRTV